MLNIFNKQKEHENNLPDGFPNVEGLDRVSMLKYSGGDSNLYIEMLTSFVTGMEENSHKLENMADANDYEAFDILSHSIKSLCRSLGITVLSEKMALLEKAGKNKDGACISENLAPALKEYARFADLLKPYVKEEKKLDKPAADASKLEKALYEMKLYIEDFDMDEAEKVFNEIWPADYGAEKNAILQELEKAMSEIDYFAVKDKIDMLIES